jgi:hypothetical protein
MRQIDRQKLRSGHAGDHPVSLATALLDGLEDHPHRRSFSSSGYLFWDPWFAGIPPVDDT